MKNKLINQFLQDVSSCGLFFNNALRVYDECYLILKEAGYPVRTVEAIDSPFFGTPLFEQDPKVVKMVDEAHEAAFSYIRSRPDTEKKLQELSDSLERQQQAAERYYQKHGTRGEF